MSRVLMIGAGGVATVAAFKIVQNQDVFTEFMIASRRKEKCDKLVKDIHAKGYKMDIQTAEVDADDVEQLKALFNSYKPELVINLALPYQDLTIMDACLACGCNYMDTANYEPKDEAHFEYSWQWAYKDKFEQAGLCAILGCGFDPGVSGIFTAYAAKHHFDEIEVLDIVDCNAGNHHKAFATNFNPEINIREITQKGLWYKDGEWIETDPLSIHKPLTYPNIGPRESYLMHHEELESLVKNYPTIKEARFWMTFGQQYLTYLDCIQNLGMSRIDEIEYPLLRNIENEMLRKLIAPTLCCKRKFEFDRRGLYASDLDSKVKYQAATIAAGIYTVNDWRKVENRPPIEGGDKVLVSANLRDIANETAVNNAPEPEPKKTKKDDKNKDGDQDDE